MASEISGDIIVAAFVFIAFLFAIMSVPRLLFVIYRSWSVVRKHIEVAELEENEEVPEKLTEIWELRNDGMAYQKEISSIMENIASIRSNITRTVVSSVIITALLFWPGFESGLVIPMIVFCLALWAIWIGSLIVSVWVFTSCITLLDEMPRSKHPESMYG